MNSPIHTSSNRQHYSSLRNVRSVTPHISATPVLHFDHVLFLPNACFDTEIPLFVCLTDSTINSTLVSGIWRVLSMLTMLYISRWLLQRRSSTPVLMSSRSWRTCHSSLRPSWSLELLSNPNSTPRKSELMAQVLCSIWIDSGQLSPNLWPRYCVQSKWIQANWFKSYIHMLYQL